MAGTGWLLPATSSAGSIPMSVILTSGSGAKPASTRPCCAPALRRSASTRSSAGMILRHCASLFGKADVIVDALLGIGGPGCGRRNRLTPASRMANACKAKIIAADIPTPGMRADRICAFHRAKTEGSTVVDIGIPLEAECCVGPGDLTLIPPAGRRRTRERVAKCW